MAGGWHGWRAGAGLALLAFLGGCALHHGGDDEVRLPTLDLEQPANAPAQKETRPGDLDRKLREELRRTARPDWVEFFRGYPARHVDYGADLVSLDGWPWWLGAGAVIGGAFLLEDEVDDWFWEENPIETWADLGYKLGDARYHLPVTLAALLTSYVIEDKQLEYTSYAIIETVVLNGVITAGFKELFRRPRPAGRNSEKSFPSGHASHSFSFATVVSNMYDWHPAVCLITYSAAGLSAASRIEDKKHHLADVVAGALLGSALGYVVSAGWKNKHEGLSIRPLIERDPRTGKAAYGLSVGFDF